MGRPSPSAGLSSPARVARYLELILRASRATGADPAIVAGMMEVEGSGEGAVSPAGALGLMQLMPDKFRSGDDPFDPNVNVLRGAEHIRVLQDRWKSPERVAAAYFGAIDGHGNVTGASDGNVNGHEYVGRFRAAYQKYVEVFARPTPPAEPARPVLDLGSALDFGSGLELGMVRSTRSGARDASWAADGALALARYRMIPVQLP